MTFRGMRNSLLSTFDRVTILDLHGNLNKQEKSPEGGRDQNVFEIRQGVSVFVGRRNRFLTRSAVFGELWGDQDRKYHRLLSDTTRWAQFRTIEPEPPFYLLIPQALRENSGYDGWMSIVDIAPKHGQGVITARDGFVVALDEAELLERVEALRAKRVSDFDIRANYFAGKGSSKYPDGDTRGWRLTEARERIRRDQRWQERVERYAYRPFDTRCIYWAEWMVDWPRPEISRHTLLEGNFSLQVSRQCVGAAWEHVFVARGLADGCLVSNKTRELGYTFPCLLVQGSGTTRLPGAGPDLNLSQEFVARVAAGTGQSIEAVASRAKDLFTYIYSVLHSRGYRTRYLERLKIDFPRIPVPRSAELLRSLSRLGAELVALHLLESPKLRECQPTYTGKDGSVVQSPEWKDGTLWLTGAPEKRPRSSNAEISSFSPVPEETWEFRVGAYRVCEKWLKDRRGRVLTTADRRHFSRIVSAVNHTISVMDQIDKVVDDHGGWPDAF